MDLLTSLGDPELSARVKACQIDPLLLLFGNELGEGHFGKVYHGQYYSKSSKDIQVAIKTIKDGTKNMDQIKEFLKEGLIMKDYNHLNVLPLIGVAIQVCNPMIVLPFMENGDLKKYIENPNNALTVRDLVYFAYQVACGMNCLACGDSKVHVPPLVHRDLAARNCMIDGNLVVKIADFGLARGLNNNGCYVAMKNRPMPIKWMAPEAMQHNKFTTMSDVWSFGVVLWELMTRGAVPYAEIPNEYLFVKLMIGYRLLKPPNCPDEIYTLMQECWMGPPSQRPGFAQLQYRLGCILQQYDVIIQAQSCTTMAPLYQQSAHSPASMMQVPPSLTSMMQVPLSSASVTQVPLLPAYMMQFLRH